MGCGNSKQETVHNRVKPDSQKHANKAPYKNQNREKEESDHKLIDQHEGKVPNMDCTNSKQEIVHDPVTPNRQKDTIEASDKVQRLPREKYDYQLIDQHARNAPSHLKNSAEDLVAYLSSVSNDSRMLARGFFVWSSENIKYDVNGYFKRAEKAPTDAESVMKNGKSVCGGYARVFELLCSKAGIPVKKLSGFAKGYSYSPSKQLTLNTETNHAWNAVQLEGKWYLLDSTWGSGHLDAITHDYKKKFDDFYFLTDPKKLVSDHFPYMDNNLEESQKWQLLPKPVSLEEFSSNVRYTPQAFRLRLQAVSHKKAYFEMEDELQMTFHCKNKNIYILSTLMLEEGNIKQNNATFCYQENGLYKILVHPRKPGIYTLKIFGGALMDTTTDSCQHLMGYKINCTKVMDTNHEYPTAYDGTFVEKCLLHEPLTCRLPAKTVIMFRISSPYLQYIKIDQKFFEKNGTMFTGKFKKGYNRYKVNIFGKRDDPESEWTALFSF